MAKHLLLEIGLEEVPARFIRDAITQLENKMSEWLTDARIEHQQVKTYATPRRLTVYVTSVGVKQADKKEEVRGPSRKSAVDAQGEWSKASLGFARSQGIEPADLYYKELNGVEYVYATKHTLGVETASLLSDALLNIVNSINFPKNMRWGSYETKFVRPIRWLLALYGEEVISMNIANVTSDRISRGHRFLGNQQLAVPSAEQYKELLRKEYVLVDIEERKQLILQQIEQLAEEKGWSVSIQEELLEEVLFLVEYPTALFGSFDPDYLNIPQDVLITTMREHQRYFPVMNEHGELLPYFITVRNGNSDFLEQVAKGNEKVLRARLSDARFFYLEDQQLPIDEAVARLEKVVFHEELGTIGDKVRRIEAISAKFADFLQLDSGTAHKISRAAELCKFDLVTQMVYEFPELQGVMGEDYALKANEDEEVARAINEHYQPRFSGDVSPTSIVGAIVSIADKIDTIVGCFLIGIIPTGSQDPYALRRQAAGIVQILRDHEMFCPPPILFDIALDVYEQAGLLKKEKGEIHKELFDFILLRVKNLLSSEVRYDVADALISSGFDHIADMVKRGAALMDNIDLPQMKANVESFVRVMKLAVKATSNEVDPSLFTEQVEEDLYAAWKQIEPNYLRLLEEGQSVQALQALSQLQEPINQFFEHVMVMVEDERIKNNRLALLSNISKMLRKFADFQTIVI